MEPVFGTDRSDLKGNFLSIELHANNVKFCYCAECKDLRPMSWYRHSNCLICGDKCATFVIPMSIYGYLMYLLSAIAAVFVYLEMTDADVGIGDLRVYLMFGSVLLALVFSLLETNRATRLAKERMGMPP